MPDRETVLITGASAGIGRDFAVVFAENGFDLVINARNADALEKLAAARGTAKLSVDASDSARGFFEKRGYVARQRNSVSIGNEWLANTTLHKQLAAKREVS